ncbi:hypothetical protein AM587_10002084 [Phytophthora nicotianae]|uniref:Uncharacterized protein n=1 Tax=Phytophthora nicotianae TaxID=4792 RepID=A0A0W8CK53_PHYNI|nr:hypothetical protein AM587_10002084 [Phytophthora nicotianae]
MNYAEQKQDIIDALDKQIEKEREVFKTTVSANTENTRKLHDLLLKATQGTWVDADTATLIADLKDRNLRLLRTNRALRGFVSFAGMDPNTLALAIQGLRAAEVDLSSLGLDQDTFLALQRFQQEAGDQEDPFALAEALAKTAQQVQSSTPKRSRHGSDAGDSEDSSEEKTPVPSGRASRASPPKAEPSKDDQPSEVVDLTRDESDEDMEEEPTAVPTEPEDTEVTRLASPTRPATSQRSNVASPSSRASSPPVGASQQALTSYELEMQLLFGSDDDEEAPSGSKESREPAGLVSPYRSSSDEDTPSPPKRSDSTPISKQPSVPPSQSPDSSDGDEGDSSNDSHDGDGAGGVDPRDDEPSFDFPSGDTAGDEDIPSSTDISRASAVVEGSVTSVPTTSSPGAPRGYESSPLVGDSAARETSSVAPQASSPLSRVLTSPTTTRHHPPPPGSALSQASLVPQEAGPGRIIVATYTSRRRRGDPDPPVPLLMTHQTVRGTRPAVLPSASFPPWVRPFLDLEFRDQGAKKCFEQVLSTVLPDSTPGDMTIRVTLESLNAFFDYSNPSHPWQVDRQLLPEDPFFFSMEGFDPLAPVSKRAPLETRIRRLWASFRGDGPMPDLGFALWERRFWILAAAVEKGFAAEEAEPNCDKDLIRTKRARFRVLMGGRSARADRLRNMYQLQYLKWSLESASTSQRSLICPEMIIEPSVPWYPVENLPFVPKTTDWLAEVNALVDRQPWRANWVYRPFDHPYNTTYVPCNREARIFCPRGIDATMANQIARAIIANPCLQPPELIPDWQDRYLTGAVPGDSTAVVSTVGGGIDDSGTPTPPPAARSSPPDEEEKESSGDMSLGVLAEAARRLSSD